MLRFLSVGLVALILLAGCLSSNKPGVVPLHLSNHWSVPVTNKTIISTKNITYIAWWKKFHDPTLNKLMKKALHDNDSLNMARARIETAQGEYKKIQYQWIPDLNFLGGYSSNPLLGYPGFWYALIPQYTLNIFKQISEQNRAKYQLLQAKMESNAVKLSVIAQITASYFTYQAEIERRGLLQKLAKDTTEYAQISKEVNEVGISSEIEQQALFSTADMVYGQQEVLERNIVMSRNSIHYLIEQEPGDLITKQRFSKLDTTVVIPGQLPMTVLENRPDLLAAEMRLRASNMAIGISASQLLPTMRLDLYAGLMAGNSRYTNPKIPVYLNDQLLGVPILRFSVLGDIARSKGLNKESYYYYIDTLLTVLKNTTNALSSYDHLTKKLQDTRKARRRIAKAYDLNNRLYRTGIQSYSAMLTSKIALDKINIRLNQDKLQQLLSIVRLYEELAGGYACDQ